MRPAADRGAAVSLTPPAARPLRTAEDRAARLAEYKRWARDEILRITRHLGPDVTRRVLGYLPDRGMLGPWSAGALSDDLVVLRNAELRHLEALMSEPPQGRGR